MNSAIHLDEPHQLLEAYGVEPTPSQDGSWCCTYYGQITVKSLDSPQFKQGTLYFPSDMRMVYRELAITIGGKQCWLWRESFGPEALELAQAIATQNWLEINGTEQRLQEHVPAARIQGVITEAMNWLQSHNPAALEWFLFTTFDWKVQEHIDALLEAVIQQDSTLLQKAMFAETGETLTLEQWNPHPSYADVGTRVFVRAVEITTERLLRRDPQLVRWFVDHAFNMPSEIKQQIRAKVKIFESLNGPPM